MMHIILLEDWLDGDNEYFASDEQILEVPDEIGQELIDDDIAEESFNGN